MPSLVVLHVVYMADGWAKLEPFYNAAELRVFCVFRVALFCPKLETYVFYLTSTGLAWVCRSLADCIIYFGCCARNEEGFAIIEFLIAV